MAKLYSKKKLATSTNEYVGMIKNTSLLRIFHFWILQRTYSDSDSDSE